MHLPMRRASAIGVAAALALGGAAAAAATASAASAAPAHTAWFRGGDTTPRRLIHCPDSNWLKKYNPVTAASMLPNFSMGHR